MVGSLGDADGSPEPEQIMTENSARQPAGPPPPAPSTVADVMRPAATTVDQNDHVAAGAYLMRHAGATALVVLDSAHSNQPIGLITDADIVQSVADRKDVNEARIRDLMTTNPTVITAATSVRDAAETMVAGRFRHLPVVDGGLIGMVDIADVCRALLDAPAR
jgi:CBS domain-containing protein